MAHLGPRVSDLLDGRLSPREEERWWTHVHECHPCRDLVEREGWLKSRLAQLSWEATSAPDDLKHHLRATPGALVAEPFPITGSAARPRPWGLVAIGGSAAGACVVGVLALGLGGPAPVEPVPPVTDLARPVAPVAELAPATPSAPGLDARERMLP